jgi:hypothetical protein
MPIDPSTMVENAERLETPVSDLATLRKIR